MKQSNLINEAAAYVADMLQTTLPQGMTFHDISHTEAVVNAIYEIGEAVQLTDLELHVAILAGWFHDIGYCYQYTDHESLGAFLTGEYLHLMGCPGSIISRVQSCITATKIPQSPKDLSEMVICDADMYHLSMPEFHTLTQRLRQEWEIRLKREYSDKQWLEESLQLLTSHSYFTGYGKSVLQPRKEKNISMLREMISSMAE